MARHKVETNDGCLFNPYFIRFYKFLGLVFGLARKFITKILLFLINMVC